MTTERVVAVAVLYGSVVYGPKTGGRHGDVYREMTDMGLWPSLRVEDETQGFLTDRGRFVDRQEALALAERAGQVREKHGPVGVLFSEDVW